MDIGFIFSSGITSGLIWAVLAIGVYITYRILDIADLGVEGTFPLGACVVAILISVGVHPIISTIIAMITGALFGILTGVLHTKLKIPAILSGIITMTALFTINMVVLGGFKSTSNMLEIPTENTIFTKALQFVNSQVDNLALLIFIFVFVVSIVWLALILVRFLKSTLQKEFKENLKKNIFYIVIISILGIIALATLVLSVLDLTNFIDFTVVSEFINDNISSSILGTAFIAGSILLCVFGVCYWFFGTEIGMSLRATGNNKNMAKAQGINTNIMIILGLAISNGLVALCGAVYAQDFGSANVQLGQGTIVIGLATIILGESIFGRQDFKKSLISVIVGSVIYFILEAAAIELNVVNYLKLVRACLIVFVLVIPLIKKHISNKNRKIGDFSNA